MNTKNFSPNRPDIKNPCHLVAVGLGLGMSRVAPGTIGTLLGVVFFLYLGQFSLIVYLACCLLLFLIGIYLCGKTAADLGVHDHPAIVWDEVVGYLITMVAIPLHLKWMVLGFILFRLFDIWKPWPINIVDQKVSGGFGIMLDDVLAGLYAWVCLILIVNFLPLST